MFCGACGGLQTTRVKHIRVFSLTTDPRSLVDETCCNAVVNQVESPIGFHQTRRPAACNPRVLISMCQCRSACQSCLATQRFDPVHWRRICEKSPKSHTSIKPQLPEPPKKLPRKVFGHGPAARLQREHLGANVNCSLVERIGVQD